MHLYQCHQKINLNQSEKPPFSHNSGDVYFFRILSACEVHTEVTISSPCCGTAAQTTIHYLMALSSLCDTSKR